MVDGSTFYRLLNHLGLRLELHGTTHCLYRGNELLFTAHGCDPLYRWLQSTYGYRLPAAHEIQMAKALVRKKMEGKIEREYASGDGRLVYGLIA